MNINCTTCAKRFKPRQWNQRFCRRSCRVMFHNIVTRSLRKKA